MLLAHSTRNYRPTLGTPKEPDDRFTDELVAGGSIRVEVPGVSWAKGDLLHILNVSWTEVCQARVARVHRDGTYTLEGI